jgi:hypothetical protein
VEVNVLEEVENDINAGAEVIHVASSHPEEILGPGHVSSCIYH